MLSKEDAGTAVGITGSIISLILFLSPIPTFYHIWKKKSVEHYSSLPYLATLGNCLLWVLYALPMVHPHSTLVVTINGTGVLIEIVYLSLFLIFSDTKTRQRVVLIVVAECILLGVLALMVLTLAHTAKLRSAVVGSFCIAANIAMYASPLTIAKLVITTKNVVYMPFLLSLFSFLSAVSWTSYALIRVDPFIAVPNVIGALLGLAQLLIYATFCRSTTERKAQVELGLGEDDTN